MNDIKQIDPNKPITFRKKFPLEKGELIAFLSTETGLSKSLLKKLLANGAVWLTKSTGGKRLRVRRATYELFQGSLVELYYDPKFLDVDVPEPKVLKDTKDWGIWFKPAGLLSQGNNYGDHASIERIVEKTKGKSFLLHRLDREAQGLMLFAYNENSARIFSEKFQKRTIKKFYEIDVVGDMSKEQPPSGDIEFDLDGKSAKTSYKIVSVDQSSEVVTTKVEVELHTGRLHQIRRHFAMLDFPVYGDPKYGKNNKNSDGMRLKATRLEFKDPFTQTWIVAELTSENTLKHT